ncbi:glycerol-3-phosphate dehydrogenase/oxidase [Flavobacteriaceae bacterium SZ-1-7]|uniref:glycerol-3-phosphate dehydrogenase/oxidase n=1 Tax=Tamlana sedimenti TaxID=3134126 RepID=UPI003121E0AB
MEVQASSFSALNREKQLKKLHSETFDIAIIGGGITGAGIALDAASRGFKVCLVEKNDFASGTSNKSTKLIHGGLRYLKQFEISLVKETGTERAVLHKLAPHLVVPEKMLLPLIKDGTYGKIMTSIGLKVYDFLADVEGDDKRVMLDKEETLEKEPLLDESIILGGGFYAEYRTDDARLVIENIKKAVSFGASIVNYVEMTSFSYDAHSKIESLNCTDCNSGNSFKIKAKHYVSATGPWVDLLRTKDHSLNNKHLHLTKGVHIVLPFKKLPIKQAVYFDVADGRMIFAIPRGRVTYVGTTDTNYFGNLEHVVATKNDAQYLLNGVNKMFPKANLSIEDIESNWAGLRPLIHQEGKDPSELSRKDEIFISKSGLISIAGGKLTGYRKMAQRAVESILDSMEKFDKENFKTSETGHIPLVRPPFNSSKEVTEYQSALKDRLSKIGVSGPYEAWYLCSNYGKQADIIIKKSEDFKNADSIERLIRAELWFGIHYEMVNSLTDFFVRRTGRLYFDVKSVKKYANLISDDIAFYLNWDKERISNENEKLNLLLKDATTFYNEEFR